MARQETSAGFEVYPLPVKTSVKEFAEKHKVDYATARGFIEFLVASGIAEQLDSRKIPGKKGKPTNIYELPTLFTLDLAA